MITAGVDGGSRAVKAAVLDGDSGRVLGTATADQGVEHDALAGRVLDEALAKASGQARQLGTLRSHDPHGLPGAAPALERARSGLRGCGRRIDLDVAVRDL